MLVAQSGGDVSAAVQAVNELPLDTTLASNPRSRYTTVFERGEHAVCLAIPGQVLELVDDERRLARVEVAGVRRMVNVGLLDEDEGGVAPGDWVLIHVGFALSRVDEEEAMATLRMLQGMGQDYEQELEELKASVIE
jgi:hydrogenase expression/formation protein HypC